MIETRFANMRGQTNHDWLESYHSFSFANYRDANHMGFRSLRVINEDKIQPGKGFGTHLHRDMEIISYILGGALEHNDSLGNGSVIYASDVQRMSAGTGVAHSEFNASKTELVHFLQIWIVPSRLSLNPSYEQKTFSNNEKAETFKLIASPDGRDGSLSINADVFLYSSLLSPTQNKTMSLKKGRYGWVQIARGSVKLNGIPLNHGDGASVSHEERLVLECVSDAEILVFDLA